MLATLILIT